jgi:hypothetical protein
VLTRERASLFEWEGLRSLEDLCFRDRDGIWLLTTAAHEGNAWLVLTTAQRAFVEKHYPALNGNLRGS